jgi:IS30 family transposase
MGFCPRAKTHQAVQRKYFVLSLGSHTQKQMAHLTIRQRYEIATLRNQNFSQSEIANTIGKDKSVISRELSRNCDARNGLYKAELAQKKTDLRHENKPKKVYFTTEVRAYVIKYLEKEYSPEQIVGYAEKEKIQCVSIERIYQFVWDDKKQGGGYHKHLRTQGKKYRKRGQAKDKRGQIIDRVDISKRPAIVEEKIRIGDLEMDLIIGKDHQGALLTINDRATGVLKMAKIDSKEAAVIEAKAIELLEDWQPYLHTITTDNGKEFANHKNLAKTLCIAFFFARPYHSWERGANENLNGLVRQYFPKKSDFTLITVKQVNEAVDKLNNRPRKRFGFKNPNEIFEQAIQNNGKVAFMT